MEVFMPGIIRKSAKMIVYEKKVVIGKKFTLSVRYKICPITIIGNINRVALSRY